MDLVLGNIANTIASTVEISACRSFKRGPSLYNLELTGMVVDSAGVSAQLEHTDKRMPLLLT